MSKVIVDLIGIESCSIDDPLRSNVFAFAGDDRYAIRLLNGFHCEVHFERHPVDDCLCCTGQWDRERAEDPFSRNEHPAQGALSEMRLALINFFLTDDMDIHITVHM